MSQRYTFDAVVLRTVDVGEADRFCILFTKEKGRVAARAKAVRKTTSRMGGSFLPMQRVSVDTTEHGSGLIITGASQTHQQQVGPTTFSGFLEHARGIDLLLALTEDEEPLPAVFELLCTFLASAPDDLPGLLAAFQARLFHLLGILPSLHDDPRIQHLSTPVQAFLQAVASPLPFEALAELTPHHHELPIFLDTLIDEHAARPMKTRSAFRSQLSASGAF